MRHALHQGALQLAIAGVWVGFTMILLGTGAWLPGEWTPTLLGLAATWLTMEGVRVYAQRRACATRRH